MNTLATESGLTYLSAQEVKTVTGVSCTKRDSRQVAFDPDRIVSALRKCFASSCKLPQGEQDVLVEQITRRVVRQILARKPATVGVEEVQRAVIAQLWGEGLADEAEHYQNYREQRRKERYDRPVSDETKKRFEAMGDHFPTDIQVYQFLSKFSRWLEGEGRRETWRETVSGRVMPWFRRTLDKYKCELVDAEWEMLEDSMYHLQAGPAMRVVQMAGPALDRCEMGAFNCTAAPIVDLFSFAEMLYILMQGCGFGFSVETEFIDQLPPLKKQRGEPPVTVVVEDDTEGWCDAFHAALKLWWDGYDVHADVSKVREAGSRLKTKGGRASGPGPLLELFAFTRNMVMARQGKRLRDTDVHRLCCFVGRIVQVGGVRRAATISISDLDSAGMRDIKSGNWWADTTYWSDGKYLTMANNSAAYDEKPTIEEFMTEWLSLVKSKSGERGIINRQAIEIKKPSRRKGGYRWIVNPCFEAGTLITTREFGAVPIADLVGKTVTVFDGLSWRTIDSFRVTGNDQPMLKVTLQDGSTLRVTDYHTMVLADGQRVEAHELVAGDKLATAEVGFDGPNTLNGAYLKGFLLGDGTLVDGNVPRMHLYEPKYMCKDRLLASAAEVTTGEVRTNAVETLGWGSAGADNRVNLVGLAVRQDDLRSWVSDYKIRLPKEVFALNRQSKCDLLAGLFDADGCAVDSENGFSYQLSSIREEFLQDVQILLKSLGVPSKIGVMHVARRKEMPGGTYDCQTSYRLTIGQAGSVAIARQVTFSRLSSFADRSLKYNVNPRWNQVVSVERDGVDPVVYCCTVPDTHNVTTAIGIVTGNCAEICLRPWGMCNLTIAVARPNDTKETLKHKVRVATYFGVMQSLCVDFRYVRKEWAENCVDERLLGVDITGHADCPLLRFGAPGRAELLAELKAVVEETAMALSARFGINYSAANTTVKPSGDSAVFFDCASGVSPRFAAQQVRWVRESKDSAIARFLTDTGVPNAPAPEAPEALKVFGFPRRAPEGSTTRDQMTALDQLNNWLEWKTCWAEHSVSATIYVGPDEWLAAGAWVYEHFDHCTGLSFLPRDNGTYVYAPNEELSEESYLKWEAEFPIINWSKLTRYEDEDETAVRQTAACANGVCEM